MKNTTVDKIEPTNDLLNPDTAFSYATGFFDFFPSAPKTIPCIPGINE